jgi:predicted adenine nucleotide alpha hydrolase (AANH) superfamily ATPase
LFFSAERLKISIDMKILLHICCAPCAIYPVQELRTAGMRVTGYFYNHNIHPYQEYQRRLETVRKYAGLAELEVIYRAEYRLEEFLANVAATPALRCLYCYSSRLEAAAAEAVRLGFDAFTTSLLYSRYQKHDIIRETGERLGEKYGVIFHYADFRKGWHEGIAVSKKMELYRQQYCGCIYSEKERYHPRV